MKCLQCCIFQSDQLYLKTYYIHIIFLFSWTVKNTLLALDTKQMSDGGLKMKIFRCWHCYSISATRLQVAAKNDQKSQPHITKQILSTENFKNV